MAFIGAPPAAPESTARLPDGIVSSLAVGTKAMKSVENRSCRSAAENPGFAAALFPAGAKLGVVKLWSLLDSFRIFVSRRRATAPSRVVSSPEPLAGSKNGPLLRGCEKRARTTASRGSPAPGRVHVRELGHDITHNALRANSAWTSTNRSLGR